MNYYDMRKPVGLDGRPVERTKKKYPYSYDLFVVWRNNYQNGDDSIYSDRLMQWDYDKFNDCCQKVWGNKGQAFYSREPKDIEQFLSLYLGKPVKLTAILEGCNYSNGYPFWQFYFRNVITDETVEGKL